MPKARAQTCSSYKHHNTVKYLVGITQQLAVNDKHCHTSSAINPNVNTATTVCFTTSTVMATLTVTTAPTHTTTSSTYICKGNKQQQPRCCNRTVPSPSTDKHLHTFTPNTSWAFYSFPINTATFLQCKSDCCLNTFHLSQVAVIIRVPWFKSQWTQMMLKLQYYIPCPMCVWWACVCTNA